MLCAHGAAHGRQQHVLFGAPPWYPARRLPYAPAYARPVGRPDGVCGLVCRPPCLAMKAMPDAPARRYVRLHLGTRTRGPLLGGLGAWCLVLSGAGSRWTESKENGACLAVLGCAFPPAGVCTYDVCRRSVAVSAACVTWRSPVQAFCLVAWSMRLVWLTYWRSWAEGWCGGAFGCTTGHMRQETTHVWGTRGPLGLPSSHRASAALLPRCV